jgi:hypothetical protein
VRAQAAYRAQHRDKILAYQAAYSAKHRDRKNTWSATYRARYPDRVKASKERHRKANAETEARTKAAWRKNNKGLLQAIGKAYREAFPEKTIARAAKRRAHLYQAIPKWFGELDEFIIEEAAMLCKLRERYTGIKWEVDHIVPLVSPLVCGFHSGSNIAVIPAQVNRVKSNRHWPDMPERFL